MGDSTLRIWLMRHGQTLFNELGLAQGWSDSPLTSQGRRGLRALADQSRDIQWAAAYSSTSERAVESAEIVLENRFEVKRDWRWKEYNFGVFEARPNAEMIDVLRRLAPPSSDPFGSLRGIFDGDFPALERGETGAQFRARVTAALEDLRRNHSSGDVLVSTHGMTIGAACSLVDPTFGFGEGVGNATFTIIEFGPAEIASIPVVGVSQLSSISAHNRD